MLSRDIGILEQPSNPRQIANLKAWYGDYVNGGTLRTTLANGANVNQWDDISGNNFHMSNKYGQPTYNSAGNFIYTKNNGLWHGTHDVMTGSESRTVFVITETPEGGGSNNYWAMFGYWNGIAGQSWVMNYGGSKNYLQSFSTFFRQGIALTNNKTYINVMKYTSGTFAAGFSWRWQGETNTPEFSQNANVTPNNKAGVAIGGLLTNSTTYSPANYGVNNKEIIYYNRALELDEIIKIETYLKIKYSVTY